MAIFTKKKFNLRKFLNISLKVFLSILFLLVLSWALLQTEWGQNWLAGQITKKFSRELQTKINIDHVKLHFFNTMDLKGVYVEDQKKDTLLYAGTVQVRITDWFFFKDTAELKYIGLKDAAIFLNRTDSLWNYDFLSSYFASDDNPKPKKKAGIHFDLKKIVLQNVRFLQRDEWHGTDLSARVQSLELNVNEISASKKLIDIVDLTITDPHFSTYSYTPKHRDTTASTPFDWVVRAKNIEINNGRFQLDDGGRIPSVTYFDGKHIDFKKINGTLKNAKWQNETLTTNLNLSTEERSGFIIKQLKSDFTFSPTSIVLDNLLLQTNRSTLKDFISLHYEDIGALENFIYDVKLNADFNKSIISSDDIAYFLSDAKSWKKNIKITGNLEGTVNALTGNEMDIALGANTYLKGNIKLIGLPKINETFLRLEAKDLRTTYTDAINFFPALRKVNNPNIASLSYLKFRGTFTGFLNDFVTYGTIQTNLGTLNTDLNMKFPKNGLPVYSGSISTNGFQLGTLINNRELGVVDFHGSVKGSGFEWQTLQMKIDGVVHKIRYDNYTYRNITAKGTFSKKQFNGDFLIKDPNADLHINGLIDLRGAKPIFNATADVNTANLKALQLTEEDIKISGRFNVNLQGSNLSDLLGTARISNATLFHNDERLSFDSLYVFANYINGQRTLKATSNEFDLSVVGNFDMASLPNAFTLFLSRYYPSYIKAPSQVKNQAFTFNISTGVIDDYIKLIDKRLTGFNNSQLSGSLNIAENTMTINADVPYFTFEKYEFSDVHLKGSGDFEKLTLEGQVLNAVIDSAIIFPETKFTIKAQNDVSDITVNTSSNQAINLANISAQVKTFNDGVSIVVNPSNFILNGKTWSIDQGGELNFRKNTIMQGQLVLRESQQEVVVYTSPSSIGNWNDLHVTLKSLNLGDLSPFLLPSNRLEGTLSGDIVVENPGSKMNIAGNFSAAQVRLDNDSIGQLQFTLAYNNATGVLTGRGNNLDPLHKIKFDLALNLTKSADFQNRITLLPENFQIKYLERFIGTLFTDLHGYMTGKIDILSKGVEQDYIAKVKLKDAGFKVGFTQVAYTIDDTEIELRKNLIDLSNITIRDKDGRDAKVNGYIRHTGFTNMYYDIVVKTVSSRMELINTTYNDNQQFFGKAKGAATFVMVGPQYDMLMDIDIRASDLDSSYITLPPVRSRESGLAEFMIEKKYGVEMTPAALRGASTNITYEVNLNATPMVNVEVIIDDLTGDIIKARGTGNLKLSSGTSAPLTMNGHFDIEEGSYLFTFQSVFKKPFILRKGANNYIEWTRDPYDAKINLEAVYTAEKVSFAPLASTLLVNQDQTRNLAQLRDNVNVIAKLTGDLFQPNFQFKLEFPSNSLIYSQPSVAFGLQQIENNTNELNKQVTYLIVFNSFAPYESTQSVGSSPFEEFTYSTASGLFFNVLNKELNQIFSKILSNNNLTLNFSGSLYNRNLVDPNARGFRLFNQVASNISLGTSFFEGRALFTVGGTFDVPLEANIQQTFQLLPNVTLEILLNKTGSLRATFFYRQNVDFISGNTTAGSPTTKRFGTSLSYNKEFDSIIEVIFGRKKKPKKDSLPPVADSTIIEQ